jgi:hypothetical protein
MGMAEQEPNKFHGHQLTWNELNQEQKNTLIQQKITDTKDRILKNK